MRAVEELKKLLESGQYCISLRKASKMLGVSMNTLRQHIYKGRIDAKIVEYDGKTRFFIDIRSLIEFIESGY